MDEHPDISSYQKVAALLAGQTSLVIAPHTSLARGARPDEYVLTLYATDIVRWRSDGGLVLASGGHQTATTAERIQWALPEPWTLSRRGRRYWYLNHPTKYEIRDPHAGTLFDLDEQVQTRHPGKLRYSWAGFQDGMVVWPDGRYADHEPLEART